MPGRPQNRALLLAVIALLLLLLAGGGWFMLFGPGADRGAGPGSTAFTTANPSGTPTASGASANPNPGTGTEGLLRAEVGDTVVTLTWQPVQGATGYLVRRDNGRDPLNAKAITATQYLDIGLTDGRTYTYTVAPIISGTEGAQLPPVQAIPVSR